MEELIPIFVIPSVLFLTVVAPIWIWNHYRHKQRTAGSLTATEREELDRLAGAAENDARAHRGAGIDPRRRHTGVAPAGGTMNSRHDRRDAQGRTGAEGDANARIRDAAARLEGAVRDLAAGASDNVAEHLDRVARRLAREAELRRGRVSRDDDPWTTDQPPSRPRSRRRLYRSTSQRWLFGVCGGVAEYYGIEVLIVRLIVVGGLLFLTTPTVITYIVAACIMKKEPSGEPLWEHPTYIEAHAAQEGSAGRQLREVRSSFERVEQRLRRIEGHVTSDSYELHRELEKLARS